MELGRECLKLWGYDRVDELIWVKVGGSLLVDPRSSHEWHEPCTANAMYSTCLLCCMLCSGNARGHLMFRNLWVGALQALQASRTGMLWNDVIR
jgi:hypothetical protein